MSCMVRVEVWRSAWNPDNVNLRPGMVADVVHVCAVYVPAAAAVVSHRL
jgi:hypothetical protein